MKTDNHWRTSLLKPKTYLLLTRCIEDGVHLGVNRAYKHTDKPTQEQLYEAIESAVINEICEWFHIDDGHLQDDTDVL
jgi:hypothetical protein